VEQVGDAEKGDGLYGDAHTLESSFGGDGMLAPAQKDAPLSSGTFSGSAAARRAWTWWLVWGCWLGRVNTKNLPMAGLERFAGMNTT
jgi:hypothetical protein